MNFNDSIRDADSDSGYIIWNDDGRLLVVEGIFFYNPFILGVELRVA